MKSHIFQAGLLLKIRVSDQGGLWQVLSPIRSDRPLIVAGIVPLDGGSNAIREAAAEAALGESRRLLQDAVRQVGGHVEWAPFHPRLEPE